MVESKREWSSEQLDEIVALAQQHLEVRNRSYHFKVYPKCFVASEFTDFIISKHFAVDRTEAVRLG